MREAWRGSKVAASLLVAGVLAGLLFVVAANAQRAARTTGNEAVTLQEVALVAAQDGMGDPSVGATLAGGSSPAADDRSGEEIYGTACSACHGLGGNGRLGPALAGNSNLARRDYVSAIILRGRDGMPPFHDKLTAQEIVAVTEYVRGAWGNAFEPEGVETAGAPAQVAGETDGTAGQSVDVLDDNGDPYARLTTQWWSGAEDSADLYERVCARCHGIEGGGGFGPAFVQNENLGDAQYVGGKILHGQGGMPAFEGLLGIGELTALTNYIRNSFGNDFGLVGPGTVAALQSRAPETQLGALRVSAFPADARLTIVGPDRFVHFESAAGQQGGPVQLDRLVPGQYNVTASKDGYASATAAVEVLPFLESRVTVNLQSFQPAVTEDANEPEEEVGAGGADPGRPIPQPELQAAVGGHDVEPQVGMAAVRLPQPVATGPINAEEYRRSCALCHGPMGEGGVGPPLAGNPNVQSTEFVLDRILNGFGQMPSFDDRLSNERIAAIATHVRVAWENGFGPVTTDDVAEQREDGSTPDAPPPFVDSGARLYEAYCSICHGGVGYGGVGPAFAGNAALRDIPYAVSRIVMGGDGMPSFTEVLSTAEMAELATYIRTSWGNEFGPVAVYEAQNYHGGGSSRSR